MSSTPSGFFKVDTAAREDVIKVKRLVQLSYETREQGVVGGHPPPSQRAPNSLEAVGKQATPASD